jgi:DNA-damage-inducible protein D
LTGSVDVKQYIKDMRSRDPELDLNWGEIVTPVQMVARDGKKRNVNTSNTK